MSVFGGDSWAREAQYRKRRVDDLLVEGINGSAFKKLANGKYACLVCPHNPILDTPLMLSMHNKGSRHLAAASRLKERDLMKQNEINKRIALSASSADTAKSSNCNQKLRSASSGKPLIEQTKKAVCEILSDKSQQQMENRSKKELSNTGHIASASTESCSSPARVEDNKPVIQHHLDYWERRERELKFTAAGWKRDGHGKWYKDENVEFDSDEEDPNVCLS
ncbi:sodium channel modifier 1-like [Neltuma alba]|uniref:sodium channel modifier 1-like n=1 Tax=Neltuma alba TaxID=207710 RepID=UPI0010A39450|nr:sodium channel modifier 1-like [Prosopis alba]